MNQMIFYCDICLKELLQSGELAVITYEQICEHFLKEGKSLEYGDACHEKFFNLRGVIRFLEDKGYIISTESGVDHINAKPCGIVYVDYDSTRYFHICKNRPQHE